MALFKKHIIKVIYIKYLSILRIFLMLFRLNLSFFELIKYLVHFILFLFIVVHELLSLADM